MTGCHVKAFVMDGMLMAGVMCLIVLLFTGCAFLGLAGDGKLSPEEYAQLVEFARGVIGNAKIPSDKLSKADREIVKTTAPLFDVKYSGYKTGRYSLTWLFDDKRSIRVEGEGDILDFKGSFWKLVLNTDDATDAKSDKKLERWTK